MTKSNELSLTKQDLNAFGPKVAIECKDGTTVQAMATKVTDKFVVTMPADRPLSTRELPSYFDMETGRHITWGQGRYDLDEWPRLAADDLQKLKDAR